MTWSGAEHARERGINDPCHAGCPDLPKLLSCPPGNRRTGAKQDTPRVRTTCRDFSQQPFSPSCSAYRLPLRLKSTVIHTAIIGTTMGHTTSRTFAQVCMDFRAAGREGIVRRTSSTLIRVIDTTSLYGLGQRRSQRGDDRDSLGQVGGGSGTLRAPLSHWLRVGGREAPCMDAGRSAILS